MDLLNAKSCENLIFGYRPTGAHSNTNDEGIILVLWGQQIFVVAGKTFTVFNDTSHNVIEKSVYIKSCLCTYVCQGQRIKYF